MASSLNPFKNSVLRNVIRSSEILITMTRAGQSPRIIGECVSCTFQPQTETRPVTIMGQTGVSNQKISHSGVQVTIVYKVGTDGSLWAREWLDVKRGVDQAFNLMFEVMDPQARQAGRERTLLESCHVINLQDRLSGDSTSNADLQATVTIFGENEELLQGFSFVQGVA